MERELKSPQEASVIWEQRLGMRALSQISCHRKLKNWCSLICSLAEIAQTQPHAAYAAFTKGVQGRWKFCQRTMASAGSFMQPLEEAIRKKFLPALFNSSDPISEVERKLYAFTAKNGRFSH